MTVIMKSLVACLLLLAAFLMIETDATYLRTNSYHRSGYTAPRKSVVHVGGGKTSGYYGGGKTGSGGSYLGGGGGYHGGAAGGGAVGADVYAALQSVQHQLKKVASRGCINGIVKAVICDQNNYDPVYCTHQYVDSGLEKIVEIEIEYDEDYDDDFDDYPLVTAGLSGITGAIDKDCEVEATYITKRGFKMRLALAGTLPFELDLFWIACDARNDH